MSPVKTSDLIQALAAEPAPEGRRIGFAPAMAAWLLLAALSVGVAMALVPLRPDFSIKVKDPGYVLETGLWLAVSLAAAALAYLSAIPARLRTRASAGLLGAVGGLIVAAVAFRHPEAMVGSLESELSVRNSACGLIISTFGAVQGAGFFVLARRLAPTRPMLTGLWAAVSSGALGGFAIQTICEHESLLHIALWHLGAFSAVLALGALLGRRLLRW